MAHCKCGETRAEMFHASYLTECRPCRARRVRNQRALNPGRRLERQRRWYAANAEKARAWSRTNYEKHRDARIEYSKAYNRAHPDKHLHSVIAWQRGHPEKVAGYAATSRARRRGASGSHTTQEWLDKCALLGNVCIYCGEAKPLTRDHKIPLARGGSHDIANIVPACMSCNAKKQAKTATEFLAASLMRAA